MLQSSRSLGTRSLLLPCSARPLVFPHFSTSPGTSAPKPSSSSDNNDTRSASSSSAAPRSGGGNRRATTWTRPSSSDSSSGGGARLDATRTGGAGGGGLSFPRAGRQPAGTDSNEGFLQAALPRSTPAARNQNANGGGGNSARSRPNANAGLSWSSRSNRSPAAASGPNFFNFPEPPGASSAGSGARKNVQEPRGSGGGSLSFSPPLIPRTNSSSISPSMPLDVSDSLSSSEGTKTLKHLRTKEEVTGRPAKASFSSEEQRKEQRLAQKRAEQAHRRALTEENAPKVDRRPKLYLPNALTVASLSRLMNKRLSHLQRIMLRSGLPHNEALHMLTAEDASIVAEDMGYNVIVDNEKAFDILPDPPAADQSLLPLRPPVVTIMGHVDHGKTTLLDTLRKTSVASGEAGGITQRIGAFSVSMPPSDPKSTQPRTICFIDTPGHAAFTAMRARGAQVTDIVILVVAADDGVMPQTKEVIDLVAASPNVQMVVAINKVDKHQANVEKIKAGLAEAGVGLEDFGGEVPCVEVSGLTGKGLPDLMETVSTLAEVAELRAEHKGRAEGFVLESEVSKGRGIVSTVLVTRGELKTGSIVLAGQTMCKVRQLMDDKGKPIKSAGPGTPVTCTGWKNGPAAGDEVIEAIEGEQAANKALVNRKRQHEIANDMVDVDAINAKRRAHDLEHKKKTEIQAAWDKAKRDAFLRGLPSPPKPKELDSGGNAPMQAKSDLEKDYKELPLVIKGDLAGTVEAVVSTLEPIGNKEAKVKVISSGVGDVSIGDVNLAQAAGGMVIGFSVKADRKVLQHAVASNVDVVTETVIYRLAEAVVEKVEGLLEPIVEHQVLADAVIQAVFDITDKSKKVTQVAGCRVGNGTVAKKETVRIMRQGEEIWSGKLSMLKRVKTEVNEVGKGLECGMQFEGFTSFQAGDTIQSIKRVEIRRKLH